MYAKKIWLCACVAGVMVGCGEAEGEEPMTGFPGPVVTGDAGSVAPGPTTNDSGAVSSPGPMNPTPNNPTPNNPGRPTPTPMTDAGILVPVPNSDSGAGPAPSADSGTSPSADGGVSPPTPSAGCLDGITNYTTKGKFTFKAETQGAVKMWVPAVPAGCKVPVTHLANGTGGTCGSYRAILEHLASHGFLATCYENTNTGQGTQCIMALEAAYSKHPELADNKIGSTGHSQGGGAAFTCISRAEEKWGTSKIYAGHSMEPASGFGDSPANWQSMYAKIKSPFFMFNGSADALVPASWVGDAFNALPDTTEAYWYEATGAAHIPVPTSWTQESTVAFFRWKLLGDKAACEYFKKMPDGNQWNLRKTQAPKDC